MSSAGISTSSALPFSTWVEFDKAKSVNCDPVYGKLGLESFNNKNNSVFAKRLNQGMYKRNTQPGWKPTLATLYSLSLPRASAPPPPPPASDLQPEREPARSTATRVGNIQIYTCGRYFLPEAFGGTSVEQKAADNTELKEVFQQNDISLSCIASAWKFCKPKPGQLRNHIGFHPEIMSGVLHDDKWPDFY